MQYLISFLFAAVWREEEGFGKTGMKRTEAVEIRGRIAGYAADIIHGIVITVLIVVLKISCCSLCAQFNASIITVRISGFGASSVTRFIAKVILIYQL